MALALYRKYRPRTFAEVIGQEHVTEPLSQALRSGRLNHAYLFSGPRGCGKTSSARILARSLNCEQGPTPDPCGVCGSCKSLATDGAGSIDVIEIDAASHGGVDDARELREKAFFAPANSRYKIYVIDEAHMVSSAGFNALLKLVEEPPDFVKFIFATTEPDKVLGTIRSRTHHYPFRLIPPAVLRPYLQQLTEAEGVHVDPAVFPLVVRAGGGSARDTLSVLDQLIAGAGDDGVSYPRAVALLGVTDVALIDEMCDALAAADGAGAYAAIDRVAEAGHDPRRFASDLLERLRDLIVLQQVPDAVAKGLIDGPADQLEAMTSQASRMGPAMLSRCADIVHTGLVEMRGTTAPRLLLELITARMLLPGADDSMGALLQRLDRLERGMVLPAASGGGGELSSASLPAAAAGSGVGPVAGSGLPAGGGGVASGGGAPGGGAGGGLAAAKAAARAAASGSGSGTRRPAAPGGRPASSAVPTSPAAPAMTTAAPAGAPTGSADGSAASGNDGVSAEPVAGGGAPGDDASVSSGGSASPSGSDSSAGQVSSGAGSGASGEQDGHPVAGGRPAGVAQASGDYDDEPPWDEEPPEPVEAASSPESRLARVRDAWQTLSGQQDLVSKMKQGGIAIRDLDGDTVVFTAPTARYAERFLEFREKISEALSSVVAGSWQIRCEIVDPNAPVAARNAGGRNTAPSRDQSTGRRMPEGRTSGQAASAAPEHNTGRTESRPSRSPRAPAADSDDEGWPVPARPAPDHSTSDRSAPDRSAPDQSRSGGASAGSAARFAGQGFGAGATQGSPFGSAVAGVSPGGGFAVSAGGASAMSAGGASAVSAGGDSDWPEPVRPDSATPQRAVPVDDDGWPEPVKPGTGASGKGASGLAKPIESSEIGGRAAAFDDAGTSHAVGASDADEDPYASGTFGASEASGGVSAAGAGFEAGDTGDSGSAVGAGSAGGTSSGSVTGSGPSSAARPASGLGGGSAFGGAAVSMSPASSALPSSAPPAASGSASAAPVSGLAASTSAAPVSGSASAGAPSAPGAGSAGGPAAAAAAVARSAQGAAAAARPAQASPAAAASGAAGPGAPVRSAAMEAARAAARGGGVGGGTGQGASAARAALANARNAPPGRPADSTGPNTGNAPGSSAWSDGTPTEEAPYDPEYDGAPSGGFQGFDPGDEPTDDVIDEKTARLSGEAQAMQLLRDAFGAEKIGEL
ncbi:DNA polymerase III subunit gamma and tau [Actinoplanes sp. NBRC 101535]|uniref:DNA polymerase III subunit gamma and tau n=1 Tax=Actinoplanes sp. NBRC 101535 TaxID=3032196 RepID=UPI0024A13989|nr:DNA polymerase III subunit gamma and tau [Actinoplanes sp. NBRC 101535]GLY05171.1 hypothetical protein Acsp01_55500 [Actinoplanes sp. NBRC 101535]